MLALRREKTHQSPRERRDIPMTAVRIENTQLASRRGSPLIVQVQNQRHLTLRAAARLIDMASVTCARRIPGVVQLEIEQSEQAIAIQLEAQSLEFAEQGRFRGQ